MSLRPTQIFGFLTAVCIAVAATTISVAAPIPAMQKFDLICRLYSRFVRELHPAYEGSWVMPTDSTRGTERFSIDLTARKIRDVYATEHCAKNVCNFIEKTSDMRIGHVGKNYIILSTDPFGKWSIRRKDGWFESHYVVSPYKTQLTTGYCRGAKFSGFPDLSPLKR